MLPSEQNPAQADILLCYIQPRCMTEPLIRESDLALPVSFIDTHFTKGSGGANMVVAYLGILANASKKKNGAPNIKTITPQRPVLDCSHLKGKNSHLCVRIH